MEVNDEEQCDEGGAAGDNNNDDRQGNGFKLFGVGGGGGDNKDRWRRRVEEVCQWARYTSLSHLGNCLHSDPELCRAMAMLLMLGAEISVADNNDDDNNDDNDDKDNDKIKK